MRPNIATSRHQSRRAVLAVWAALLAVLCGCAPATAPVAGVPGHVVRGWVTSADHSRELSPVDAPLEPATAAPAAIEIDPTRRYQSMVGFGAAITDASAWLIRTRMDGAQRAALMKELFG